MKQELETNLFRGALSRTISSAKHAVIMVALLSFAVAHAEDSKSFQRKPLRRLPAEAIALQASASLPGASQKEAGITLIDAQSGRYALRWIGRDGTLRELKYIVPDRVDVIVSAAVSKKSAGRYRYDYTVANLGTSAQDVFGFAVQTFGQTVRVTHPTERYIGPMHGMISEFSIGTWYRVPFLPGELPPGSETHVVLESDAPPGLVYVRVHGGPLGLKGVGEEMPTELESKLPKYEVWPVGITVGPVGMTSDNSYPFEPEGLDELVVRMESIGWLSAATRQRYQQLIKRAVFGELSADVARDFQRGRIAAEVAYVLETE